MSNRFDRLEKLFAYRRKGSLPAAPTCQSPSPTPRHPDTEQQFPSPSFIRPKALRMSARDEVCLRDSPARSPSVPDMFTCHSSIRTYHSHSRNHGSTASSSSTTTLPPRPPSFCSSQKQHGPGLRHFRFPNKPTLTNNGQVSPRSSIFEDDYVDDKSDPPRIPSPRSRSPLHIDMLQLSSYRSETPPDSDPEDNTPTAEPWKTKKLPELPRHPPPTPGQSPQPTSPLSELLPRLPQLPYYSQSPPRSMPSDITLDLTTTAFEQAPMRRHDREDSFASCTSSSTTSSVLREPDVNEFLNLSDDDIAEDAQDDLFHLDLPPSSSQSQPPKQAPRLSTTALLTLISPPRASQPATAAAFEAARIAKRYDFDLIYVVNLWPGQLVAPHGEPLLIGRLLAAHGLHHVPSPLQISSLVHTTILRSHGWIEYQNTQARPHDLARGYASAFYTGQYAPSLSSNKGTPVSSHIKPSNHIDRGIVFAAYRKPRPGHNRLGHSLDPDELAELDREAESLVELLIDIHLTNRLRQPPTCSRAADETGPMPIQQLIAA